MPIDDRLLQALLACSSATAVIEAQFGAPVIIRRVPGPTRRPAAHHLGILQLEAREGVLHRRVRLAARGIIVSEADLWYVAARLPAGMQRALLETDTPFGRIVAPLRPHRETLEVRVAEPRQRFSLEIDALLRDRAGQPIALVSERYFANPFVENQEQLVSHTVPPHPCHPATGE